MWGGRALDRSRPLLRSQYQQQRREYGFLVVRALRGVLKIRYLLLGGAVGGGVTLQKVRPNDLNYNFLVKIKLHKLATREVPVPIQKKSN